MNLKILFMTKLIGIVLLDKILTVL